MLPCRSNFDRFELVDFANAFYSGDPREDVAGVIFGTVTFFTDEGACAHTPQQLNDFTDRVGAMKRRTEHVAVTRACQKKHYCFYSAG